MHEVRSVEKDADSVARLRRCGVILVGKANMHELGMGTTGNNPNYGYVLLIAHLTTLIDVLDASVWYNLIGWFGTAEQQEILMHLIGIQEGRPQVLQQLLLLVYVLLHLEQMVEVGNILFLGSVFLIFLILLCNVARMFKLQ